jgi:hypothetical protein
MVCSNIPNPFGTEGPPPNKKSADTNRILALFWQNNAVKISIIN